MQTFISITLSLLINLLLILGLCKFNQPQALLFDDITHHDIVINTHVDIDTATEQSVEVEDHKPLLKNKPDIAMVLPLPHIEITPLVLPKLTTGLITPSLIAPRITSAVTAPKLPTDVTSQLPTIPSIDIIDTPPTVIFAPTIDYPIGAKRLKRNGMVSVNILINESGIIEKVNLISATGHQSFKQAVLNKIKQHRFTPPMHNKKPVKVWAKKEFTFRWRQ